jgi:hypothetical protein
LWSTTTVRRGINLDVGLAVNCREASNRLLVEDRRKGQRRKLYGHQYLAMLIGVLPEDRRQNDRRREAAKVSVLHADASTAETSPAEENAAS